MNISALTSSAPADLGTVNARIDALHSRMGTTVTGSRFATALATANTPATKDPGSAPALGANPAAQLGQGVSIRPASLTTATATNGQAAAAITEAKKYLGTMYQWGGDDPSTGFDCSGLVQWSYKQQGITLPRTTYDQVNAGRAVEVNAQSLRPGDLLFTNYSAPGRPEHVLMYLGDGKAIEAPRTGKPVRIRDIDLDTVKQARRVTPDTTQVTATGATGATGAVGAAGASGWEAKLPAAAAPYVGAIKAAAAREGIAPELVASVIWHESNFNANAISPVGAYGLGQLMPGTAAELGVDRRDPVGNINGTAKYLAQQLKSFGTVELAAAAYNAGPGAVRKNGGVPPYAETRAYVLDVSDKYNRLRGTR